MAHDHQHSHESPRRSNRNKWIFIGFVAVAGFFLVTEHRAHLYGALPFLLILACPLMHLFHGHGSHGGPDRSGGSAENVDANKPSQTHDHGRSQS